MSETYNLDAAAELIRLLDTVASLRHPERGCPWDLKQTFQSLKPYLIQESYETADAIDVSDAALCEELGDLISVIVTYTCIAEEQKRFSFAQVLKTITDKLIRRHPHVFGDVKVSGEEEVLKNWEAIKREERAKEPGKQKGLLDGLPRSMPALLRSHEIGVRCARVGFDWDNAAAVGEKVREELNEFLDELPNQTQSPKNDPAPNKARIFEEFGDLLFSLAQQSRHLGFNAEEALAAANTKFLDRFRIVERLAKEIYPSQEINALTPQQMEELWTRAKIANQSILTRD